jgi:Domain of unknown function (DUF5618)
MELTPYQESLRYMNNAKETLQKAGKDVGIYKDKKYVRTASGTAYSAVLLALDEYLKQKEGLKFKKPKSIEDYQSRVTKQDKKLLALLVGAYDILHILGYYHGTNSVDTITRGFNNAYKIIEYIKD